MAKLVNHHALGALLGLLLACCLVGCAAGTPRPGEAGASPVARGVVPFVARPADLAATPPPAPMATPPQVPVRSKACRGWQVRVAWTGGNGATGTTIDAFTVRNTSDRACSVGPPVGLVVVTRGGHRIRATLDEFFLGGGTIAAEDLAPGASAAGALLTHLSCGTYDGNPRGAVLSAHVQLILGSDRVNVGQPNGRAVNVRCRPGVQPPGRFVPPAQPETDGTVAALSAQLQMSSQVRRGAVVWPLLTLTNRGHRPVPLSPCPSYLIGIGIMGTKGGEHSYRLNCDTVTTIRPGQAATYQLRVQAPESAGLSKIYWQMLPRTANPPPPATAGAITIS